MKKIILLRHGQSVWNLENRFTGWTDVELTQKGLDDSVKAGVLLKKHDFRFDVGYTSYLKRAIKTLWAVLEVMDLAWIPAKTTWALNERHYGALQGLNKDEVAEHYGKEQVQRWRRYPNESPPALDKNDPRYPGFDIKYEHLREDQLPLTESLKQTAERTLSYWHKYIETDISHGKNVLVVAHNNTLRALIQHIENLSDDETIKLDLEMGSPMVYEFNDDYHNPIARYYLK